MKKRYNYELIINDGKSKGKALLFSYGNTKDIELRVLKQSARAKVGLTKNYFECGKESNQSYLVNMFKEAAKRIMLIHLLKYQVPMNINSVKINMLFDNAVLATYDYTDQFRLYTMIGKKLLRPISKEWGDKEIQQAVLKFQKSKEKMAREVAALYAYLYSKTKIFETERFSYLWIAMNGLYASKAPDKMKTNERDSMSHLVASFDLGNKVLTKKNNDVIGKRVMIELKDYRESITRDSLTNGIHKSFADSLEKRILHLEPENNVPYDLSAYGYMITGFPYYLRCTLFHSNRPIELFSFEGDMELNALMLANGLLEEFLDEYLISMFRQEVS